MKKLVTAKEQFEARLAKLNIFGKNGIGNTKWYCGHDEDNRFVMLRSEGDEYLEFPFGDKYEAIVTSEEFLVSMVGRFKDYKWELKPLFDWYASADHDINKECPFNLEDLFNLCIEKEHIYYEDKEMTGIVYTAQEQWEDDSKNAREIPSHEGCTCKFEEKEDGLYYYINEGNGYSVYHLPTWTELIEDEQFVSSYISIVQDLHPQDLYLAIQWLRTGSYNMSDVTLWDIKEAMLGREKEITIYENKETQQDEQSIKEMIALTPEQQEALDAFINAKTRLNESGVKLISYYDDNEFFAVNGNNNLDFESDYWITDEDEYEDISDVLTEKHHIPFYWDIDWACDCALCAKRIK